METIAGNECRHEKGKALDTIPMSVGEKEVRLNGHLPQHVFAQRAQSCSPVKDQAFACNLQLYTGCVATISGSFKAWRWDTTPHAPEFYGKLLGCTDVGEGLVAYGRMTSGRGIEAWHCEVGNDCTEQRQIGALKLGTRILLLPSLSAVAIMA
ncbi:MAG TPA: hypothetical protein V6C88_09155 [Chroococcidiopsis sp.]